MEMTMQQASASELSKGRVWTGRILSLLVVLFLVFDGVTKVMKERHVMEAAVQLGFPDWTMPVIGSILLVCTLIYAIPRTAVLGAVLLTGYLGGAVCCQLRVANPLFETLFPVFFGVVVWAGLFLRNNRLAGLFFTL
ncbi:MAG TPA: DoxX family protein [Candidatus Acidoferrales bacterium]|nr:DoxX family protein [Candidatus Acidoferrales bacterium]